MKKLALIFLLASGCGVSTQHVDNSPPKLHPELIQLGVEFGSFPILNASAFLWPQNLTEDEAQVLIRTVNSASEAADPFFVQATVLTVQDQTLQGQWNQIACVDKYAVLGPDQDPIDVERVTEWKSDEDLPDKAAQDERNQCEQNQIRRDEIRPLLAAAQQGAAPYVDQIDRAIDPDQQNKVNTRSIKVRSLVLNADGSAPSVSLGGFSVAGYNPSTENGKILNAKYDARLRVLSFAVPEVNENKEPTGNLYHFAIERGNDHGPLARFTGDMNLMNGSKIVRYGSARIDAFPPQQ